MTAFEAPIKGQGPHAMLPTLTHDERSRTDCIAAIRRFFTSQVVPGNRLLYEKILAPAFTKAHGRAPAAIKEVDEILGSTFHYRAGSLIGRATQELLWDTVGEAIERQLPELNARAASAQHAHGSLAINPRFQVPDYIEKVDIHVMPGNFHTELSNDDVFAGALYDTGAYIFAYGSRGPFNEKLGTAAVTLLKRKFPDFRPRRILEMGCGVGSSTLPLKDGYPDAEVHAIDVGAPMLRYAHARAESLGRAIHFSQQDAQHTGFPDGHFDLVVSVIVNHEMPLAVNQAVLKETYRLLAPGGISLHEGALGANRPDRDPFAQFMSEWFQRNNNEPFGLGVDIPRDYAAAGFSTDDLFYGTAEDDVYLKGQLPPHVFVGATKRK